MFGPLYRDVVTLRRPKKRRSRKGPPVYEQVLDAGEGPASMRCRITQGGRRVYDTDGARTLGDATMVYRVGDKIEPKPNDLIVAKDGQTYKVLRIDPTRPIGARRTYAEATLEKTAQKVPADAEATEEP
ncbi:MAG: hypothetical protein LN413_00020 [Candidatus Thermoplasmatota archaeon]|nr:hypothetical protein [Candidatus Thermoplasmatota archaeon]